MLSGQEIDHFSEKESVGSKGTESIAKEKDEKLYGRWTEDEKMAYFCFVQSFPQLFDKSLTKSFRSFKIMAKFIRTRTAVQCRSHHQKMVRKACINSIAEMGAWMNRMVKGQMGEDHVNSEIKVEDTKAELPERVLWGEDKNINPNSDVKVEFLN